MGIIRIAGVGNGRAKDFAARQDAKALTRLEELAVSIIRGGEQTEATVWELIDKAQEEYGSGSYRVPVRVLGDRSRMLVVATTPMRIAPHVHERILRDLEQSFIKDPLPNFVVVTGGMKIEVYEVQEGQTPGVVLSAPGKPE